MELYQITDDYAVAPQIAPEDMVALKAAGFTTVVCNRPDAEIPVDLHADAMAVAAAEAGLEFVVNPIGHAGLDEGIVTRQAACITSSEGPVLAYCRSGTRSTVVWGVARASDLGADAVIEKAAAAGYDLSHMRPLFESLAARQASSDNG